MVGVLVLVDEDVGEALAGILLASVGCGARGPAPAEHEQVVEIQGVGRAELLSGRRGRRGEAGSKKSRRSRERGSRFGAEEYVFGAADARRGRSGLESFSLGRCSSVFRGRRFTTAGGSVLVVDGEVGVEPRAARCGGGTRRRRSGRSA